tara:strand:+ start:3185 stop:4036 length:852 start_codon:yes stop_codon:yes gene_type:complete
MKKYIFYLFVIATILISPADSYTAELKIHFFDVGEGEAILVVAPNGATAMIDAGNLAAGYRLAEKLDTLGVKKLTHMIFTHHHIDHIGGAFNIVQKFSPDHLYDNEQDLTNKMKKSDPHRWYSDLVRDKEKYKPLKAGDSVMLGSVRLKVIWPKSPDHAGFNQNSIVLIVEYGKFRALLTGDLVQESEKELLLTGGDISASVLKVGHHGSIHGSGDDFLKAVSPRTAIISVNQNNIRGYPSSTVIERIKSLGVKLYRTDMDGDITVTVSRDGKYAVSTESESR